MEKIKVDFLRNRAGIQHGKEHFDYGSVIKASTHESDGKRRFPTSSLFLCITAATGK